MDPHCARGAYLACVVNKYPNNTEHPVPGRSSIRVWKWTRIVFVDWIACTLTNSAFGQIGVYECLIRGREVEND